MPYLRVRQLDLLDRAAELLDPRQGGVHLRGHARLEPRLAHAPDAEAQAVETLGARQRDAVRDAERGGVARVPALDVAQQDGGVRDVARERAALVER